MTTLKFLRALADELGTKIEHLDDDVVEHLLENWHGYESDIAARVYRETLSERVNP